jgi:hypothetical protein
MYDYEIIEKIKEIIKELDKSQDWKLRDLFGLKYQAYLEIKRELKEREK